MPRVLVIVTRLPMASNYPIGGRRDNCRENKIVSQNQSQVVREHSRRDAVSITRIMKSPRIFSKKLKSLKSIPIVKFDT